MRTIILNKASKVNKEVIIKYRPTIDMSRYKPIDLSHEVSSEYEHLIDHFGLIYQAHRLMVMNEDEKGWIKHMMEHVEEFKEWAHEWDEYTYGPDIEALNELHNITIMMDIVDRLCNGFKITDDDYKDLSYIIS